MGPDAQHLLREICRCPVVTELLASPEAKHPCRGVVDAQGEATDWRQVPEPWSGSLERARVLAVVSHPVLHDRDLRPVWRSTWDHTERFFERRLVGDGPKPRVSPGAVGRRLRVDDPGGLPTDPELVAAVERTTELLGRVPSLLEELAVTHVVRCPTTGDLGVNRAVKACPDRWLRAVVNACPAPVLLAIGATADKGLSRVLGLFPGGTARVTEVVVDGVQRMVVVVPHPQGPGGARPLEELLGDQLLAVRDLLGGALAARER